MKINNINVEQFLKDDKLVVDVKKSKEIANYELKKKPSIIKKHVKKPKKLEEALIDLDQNHNWSWYDEIKYRNRDCMNKPMVFYRGNEMTGSEVFEKADTLANALLINDIKKGDEILVCMANVPEFLIILLAANKCCAKVKIIGESFDPEFIKQIVTNNPKKLFIATDDKYQSILPVIRNAGFKHKVIVSLTDSLKDGIDPYSNYDNKFYEFKNKLDDIKKYDPEILSFSDYLIIGKKNHNSNEFSFPKSSIDDDFTITFTSGSTKIGWPKPIVHKNRHYISIGRVHDPDLSRMPAMRNMRGLAYIPTHSNTDIASGISDPLSQTCVVAFEPIYDPNFLAYSLLINEPGFVPATRSFWLNAVKKFKTDENLQNVEIPFAVNYVAVGEDIAKNEVEYINKMFKELKAGTAKLPKPLSPISLSVGGGNCEHGGLFFTLFKSLREKIALRKSIRNNYGLTPFQIADIAVLHEDGTECDYEEIGNLVANSPCTMKEYEDNAEATKNFYVTDYYDRTWGNCNVWAYIAKNGNVVMKGRRDSEIKLSTGKKIPNFLIAENILSDDKNILSCEVVTVQYEDNDIAVAHIELQPDSKKSIEDILQSIEEKNRASFSEELSDRIVYRIRSYDESFPLTKSGKRSIRELEIEGIENCVKPISYFPETGVYNIVSADYLIKNNMQFKIKDNDIQKVKK